jgi:sortase A
VSSLATDDPPHVAPTRVRKFDRPPPPHDWRWWVGGFGKVLIATGLLMFGFVSYQLWGTGIETARAQNSLENEFEDLFAAPAPDTLPTAPPEPTTPPESAPPTSPAVDPPPPLPPEVENGDAIARIELPRIGVDKIVVAGVDKDDLKKGPGHYPETPLPGQLGNSAIAGHRTTFGQPFIDVDQLQVGDEIIVTTLAGRYVYRVTGQQIVRPSDSHVIATTDPTTATLTLTSCHPKYSARERIIIFSELDEAASDGDVTEATINYGRSLDADPSTAEPDPTNTVVGGDELDQTQIGEGLSDAFAEGWFSDPGANSQVALWGSALALIGALSYLVSRRARRDWVGLVVGIVPFAVALYFFFQNVNRLMPPNL